MCARHPFLSLAGTLDHLCAVLTGSIGHHTGSGVFVFLQGWRGSSQTGLCDCQLCASRCASSKVLNISVVIVYPKNGLFQAIIKSCISTYHCFYLSWSIDGVIVLLTFLWTKVGQCSGWLVASVAGALIFGHPTARAGSKRTYSISLVKLKYLLQFTFINNTIIVKPSYRETFCPPRMSPCFVSSLLEVTTSL